MDRALSLGLGIALPEPALDDGAILLRPPVLDDLSAVVEACNDPAVQMFTRVPAGYGERDGRAFIEGAAPRREAGASLELVVASAADRSLRGMIGIVRDRHDPLRAEIGYWVAPAARGAGVATRALMLLSRWSLDEGGFARLDLHAAVANPGSRRTAERCGFVLEGLMRAAWYRGPERGDVALYSLIGPDLDA